MYSINRDRKFNINYYLPTRYLSNTYEIQVDVNIGGEVETGLYRTHIQSGAPENIKVELLSDEIEKVLTHAISLVLIKYGDGDFHNYL